MDRDGKATPLVKQPGDYYVPTFSPDGKELALQVGTGNVWIYNIAGQTLTPLTFPPANCIDPIWSRDGKRILCYGSSTAGGGRGIHWIPSDGSGSLQLLTKPGDQEPIPFSWTPDGKTLVFSQFRAKNQSCCELMTLNFRPDGKPGEPQPLLGRDSEGALTDAVISPDGHWLAYDTVGLGAGDSYIYVIPFPGPGGKRQVSTVGGWLPHWSRTGHELYYMQSINPGAIVSVPYTVTGNSFQPGVPKVLFQGGFEIRAPYASYDVAPDDQHFALLVPAGGNSGQLPSPTVVLNWFARVKKLVAAGQK